MNSTEGGVTKEDFEGLVRHGPKGDVKGSLEHLRKLVLLGGVDADADGMVWLPSLPFPSSPTSTTI